MTFSNKKEDVIYMELTPYGRQLLSRGELMPMYYSFFDDDIVYDISQIKTSDTSTYPSGFLSESNGEIKSRILSSTPYLKPTTCFLGRDKKAPSIQNYYLYKDLYRIENDEKMSFLNYPLGTSREHSGDESPFWDIKYLHGTASSSEPTPGVYVSNTSKFLISDSTSVSSLPFRYIPQINFEIDYELSIRNVYTDDDNIDKIDLVSPNLQITNIAADGTYVSLKESQLLLYILEENAFSSSDSFNVEVFKRDRLNKDKYIPLKFASEEYEQSSQKVMNDLLVDLPEEESYEVDLRIDNNYVEYYFDLRLDSEVPEEDICSGLKFLKRKD